jgi:hypothetical protein
MDSTSPHIESDFLIGRKNIKAIFREGNKLMQLAVNNVTCPLGDVGKRMFRFEHWMEDQHHSIQAYFKRTYTAEIAERYRQYYKPVVKHSDGYWLSASDMDNAMLNN